MKNISYYAYKVHVKMFIAIYTHELADNGPQDLLPTISSHEEELIME